MNLPLGYAYAATYAGIRKVEKDDLALIVTGLAASAAAVFTENRVVAAPVKLCERHLKLSRGLVGAILVNAGNANCATRTGDAVALATSKAAAKLLKLPVSQVLPASTGVIGVELDPRRIIDALPRLVSGLGTDRFDDAARAILTTDLVPKTAFAETRLRRGVVRTAGMTKGSGMIQPRMATTLGFVMTDAAIPAAQLRAMLKRGVDRSYNRLSVDGDTSTNDTLVLLANGASGVRPDARELPQVEEGITQVMERLAQAIARDGEGARKFITIVVSGASNNDGAVRMARAIANSPLVKTAIAGADANWGRIVMAVGKAGEAADRDNLKISFGGHVVAEKGQRAARYNEKLATKAVSGREVEVAVELGLGKGAARVWTCDLTHGYIDINGSYRS